MKIVLVTKGVDDVARIEFNDALRARIGDGASVRDSPQLRTLPAFVEALEHLGARANTHACVFRIVEVPSTPTDEWSIVRSTIDNSESLVYDDYDNDESENAAHFHRLFTTMRK